MSLLTGSCGSPLYYDTLKRVSESTYTCIARRFSVAKKEPEPVGLFRDSAHIFISVLLKPLSATVIIGKNFFDFRVEFCRMIHLFSVAEFVNNNAVNDFIGQ